MMRSDPEPPITEPSEALREPSTYPESIDSPTHIETHISHVYLTGREVYKLKKAVQFPFLDFSTPEKRRAACEEEVRINRRLAPEVYLGVYPIGRNDKGEWKIGGEVEPEDWLVKMRQLPEDQCLEQRIRADQISANEIDSIIDCLCSFYRKLSAEKPDDYIDTIIDHVRGNFTQLLHPEYELDERLVYRVHAAQLQTLLLQPLLFQNRVDEGHIVEGHGDLRPDHIYLTAPPVVIDGIEFNREFRTIDTADELSFLAITCELCGNRDLGETLLRRCHERLGDQPPVKLLNFYRCYRACVRAKVAALRTEQTVGNEETTARRRALTILQAADRYARRLGPPRIVVTRGLSGTGKSTFARTVADAFAAKWLATDQIRKSQIEEQRIDSDAASLYSRENRRRVYQRMLAEAESLLDDHVSIVLDGTFLDPDLQTQAYELANKKGAPILFATCECPEEVALARLKNRAQSETTLSDAGPGVHQHQRLKERRLAAGIPAITLDSTHTPEQMLRTMVAHWRSSDK